MSFKDIKLPDGFHIQKTGGRPRKDAKFIAIALCRMWRTEELKEQKRTAYKWILQHWEARGVTEEAHIRDIVRRMGQGVMAPLNKTIIRCTDAGIIAVSPSGKKGWIWAEHLFEAIPVKSNVTIRAFAHPFKSYSISVEDDALNLIFTDKNKDKHCQ